MYRNASVRRRTVKALGEGIHEPWTAINSMVAALQIFTSSLSIVYECIIHVRSYMFYIDAHSCEDTKNRGKAQSLQPLAVLQADIRSSYVVAR